MSAEWCEWAARLPMEIKGNMRNCAWVLGDSATPDGVVTWRVSHLAPRGGMSERTFYRQIHLLEAAGWVTVARKSVSEIHHRNGGKTALHPGQEINAYTLQAEAVPEGERSNTDHPDVTKRDSFPSLDPGDSTVTSGTGDSTVTWGGDNTVTCTGDSTVTSNRSHLSQHIPPSCPPEGGRPGPETKLTGSKASLILFEAWWQNEYPNSKYPGRSRGKKHKAQAAWVKLHSRGFTLADVQERTARYSKARDLFRRTYGHTIVEAPLMNASTFLADNFVDWEEICTGKNDDRINFWVGPLREELAAAAPNAGDLLGPVAVVGPVHEAGRCCDGTGLIETPDGMSQCRGLKLSEITK